MALAKKPAPPRHIAIIMDGNGRWAKKRGLPRNAGHAAGGDAFRRIANYCRTLVVQPWDTSLLKEIQKAIQASELGINPQNDGRVIRLVFPQLTEERRKELAKQVKKYAEEAKVAMRNIRRDGMDYVKKLKKNSEITEDEQKKAEKDLQDMLDKYIKKTDEALAAKEKELMAL